MNKISENQVKHFYTSIKAMYKKFRTREFYYPAIVEVSYSKSLSILRE